MNRIWATLKIALRALLRNKLRTLLTMLGMIIGVGAGASNYFQPVNWRMQYFNYFILDNNAANFSGGNSVVSL